VGKTLHIARMEDEHLKEMVKVDEVAFEREQPRSIENFVALKLSDPEGCFVILDDDVVGYSYSKTLGSEGYLGPVALLPEYQNKGHGKALISKNLRYLKTSCRVIGLEVLPEYGENIGLYHKLGFISGFPSLLFKFPDSMAQYSEYFEFKFLSDFTNAEQNEIIDEIDGWTRAYFENISYRKDIEATVDLNGAVLISFDQGEPVGFLAYLKNLVPNLWGAVKIHSNQKDVMREMLMSFNGFSGEGLVKIEVNSRYSDLVDLLTQMNFRVYRSVNRMFLKGYEGNHFKRSEKMIMRAWRG
jgi:GNAT superfamily N-acetyltransferase